MLPPDKTMFMAEQNRQKAANQVSQEKRATVRSMSQIGKANRQAVETNQGAVMVFFGMLVTVTVSRGEQESQRLEAASRPQAARRSTCAPATGHRTRDSPQACPLD